MYALILFEFEVGLRGIAGGHREKLLVTPEPIMYDLSEFEKIEFDYKVKSKIHSRMNGIYR